MTPHDDFEPTMIAVYDNSEPAVIELPPARSVESYRAVAADIRAEEDRALRWLAMWIAGLLLALGFSIACMLPGVAARVVQ